MKLAELKVEVEDESFDSFYISFGDIMVLLCAFFVMLLSMSEIKSGSFERIKSQMTGKTENTLVELATTLEKIINGVPGVPGASVELAPEGIRLNLDTAVLFEQGSASLRASALKPLRPILKEIRKTKYLIDVEGHTDDVPYYRYIEGVEYSNWSLSGLRASSMIHHLLKQGFDPSKLRAIGYAAMRPVVDYKTQSVLTKEEARRKNRRVSLLIR